MTPRIFYITEKAWNYYPYTITGEGTGTWALLDTLPLPAAAVVGCRGESNHGHFPVSPLFLSPVVPPDGAIP